jgi:hypothetical protein
MEQVKIKIPAEAVELYTRYIHGEVSRRDFLAGVKRFTVAGLWIGFLNDLFYGPELYRGTGIDVNSFSA